MNDFTFIALSDLDQRIRCYSTLRTVTA